MDIFSNKNMVSPSATEVEGTDHLIVQIVPCDPNWRAVIEDDQGKQTFLPIACFALMAGPDVQPYIRPMVLDIDGQIDDVEVFEGFLCVVPPEHDPTETIAIAKNLIESK